MSNSFLAGQRLVASRMPYQKLWTVQSTTATSSIGTSETVIASAPSSTYVAGAAYRLEFKGIVRSTTGVASLTTFRVRDTNVAGTLRQDLTGTLFTTTAATVNNGPYYNIHYVANTGGSDITSRVLALSIASSSAANLILFNAGSTIPWFWTCHYVGLATDYPEAIAL